MMETTRNRGETILKPPESTAIRGKTTRKPRKRLPRELDYCRGLPPGDQFASEFMTLLRRISYDGPRFTAGSLAYPRSDAWWLLRGVRFGMQIMAGVTRMALMRGDTHGLGELLYDKDAIRVPGQKTMAIYFEWLRSYSREGD